MTIPKNYKPPSADWVRRMASSEAESESIAASGLAHEVGFSLNQVTWTPFVFGRFVELARRRRGTSLEELARSADIELAELVAIERSECAVMPSPRTVFSLSKVLGFPVDKLMELAGLTEPTDEEFGRAAIRFAARSEPTTSLSKDERAAYEEFVKVLADKPALGQ